MKGNKLKKLDVRWSVEPLSLGVKLGSIAVHAEEMISAKGHAFDRIALQTLLDDSEVREWLGHMRESALLPVKR